MSPDATHLTLRVTHGVKYDCAGATQISVQCLVAGNGVVRLYGIYDR